MRAKKSLMVYRSADNDGATYALSPPMRTRLAEQFGAAAHVRSRIFIAHESEADRSTMPPRSMLQKIVELLTGLSEEQLATVGEVRFQDPVTEEVIGSWTPARV